MKTKTSRLITIVFIASTLFGLAGCAEMGASNTKSLLVAAGFRVRTPQTATQKEIYAALPSYQVQRATVKGRTFYVFKDEREGTAYIGGDVQYQNYRQLAIQQQIAQNYYDAVAMNQVAATRWYGAYGARGIYWR